MQRSVFAVSKPSIWFTRCGDIDDLSRDRLLSLKNQWGWDQVRGRRVQTRDPRQLEIIGGVKEACVRALRYPTTFGTVICKSA
ncbi:hypothetical protein TNCV_1483851 [Trichonephila clavipes]|nr:hypothetical protein TNCV_1483851 [Trichonephila clavipes]